MTTLQEDFLQRLENNDFHPEYVLHGVGWDNKTKQMCNTLPTDEILKRGYVIHEHIKWAVQAPTVKGLFDEE